MSTIVTNVQELVAAREARGLGQGDVAHTLKLAPRQVVALESGDWEALPGLAFVRGALRGYGRLVDADVDALLQSVSGLVAPTGIEPVASLHQPMPRRSMLGFGAGGGGSRLTWAVLAAVGIIALAFFFVRDGNSSRMSSWLNRSAPAEASAAKGADDPSAAASSPSAASPSAASPPGSPAAASPSAVSSASGPTGTRVDEVPIPGQGAAAQPGAANPAR